MIQLLFGADRSNHSCECDLNMIGFKLQFPNIRTHKIDFMTTVWLSFKDTFQNWTTLRGSNNPAQMGPFFRWAFFPMAFFPMAFFLMALFQMVFFSFRWPFSDRLSLGVDQIYPSGLLVVFFTSHRWGVVQLFLGW